MWGRGPCLNFKPLRILNGETWWKGEETRIYSDLKTEDDGNTFFSTQPNHWSCRPPDESRNQPRSTTASGWQPSSVWLTLPCHEDLHIFLIVSKMDNGAFSNCFPKKCVALKLETAKRFLSKTTKLWHKRIPGACQGGIRFTSWSDIFLHDIFSCQQITAALNIEELEIPTNSDFLTVSAFPMLHWTYCKLAFPPPPKGDYDENAPISLPSKRSQKKRSHPQG